MFIQCYFAALRHGLCYTLQVFNIGGGMHRRYLTRAIITDKVASIIQAIFYNQNMDVRGCHRLPTLHLNLTSDAPHSKGEDDTIVRSHRTRPLRVNNSSSYSRQVEDFKLSNLAIRTLGTRPPLPCRRLDLLSLVVET